MDTRVIEALRLARRLCSAVDYDDIATIEAALPLAEAQARVLEAAKALAAEDWRWEQLDDYRALRAALSALDQQEEKPEVRG